MDTAGARASFEEFVAARSISLGRVAYLLTGHRHDAEDLLQTALIKVAMRWNRVEEPEAYVRRVLYTQAVSRWRLRGRKPEVLTDQPLDEGGVEGGVESDWETRVVLDQALRGLTPKQRAVLVLRFYEDMSESQTAAMLECSVGTVKSQTRHALERLRVMSPHLVQLLTDRPQEFAERGARS